MPARRTKPRSIRRRGFRLRESARMRLERSFTVLITPLAAGGLETHHQSVRLGTDFNRMAGAPGSIPQSPPAALPRISRQDAAETQRRDRILNFLMGLKPNNSVCRKMRTRTESHLKSSAWPEATAAQPSAGADKSTPETLPSGSTAQVEYRARKQRHPRLKGLFMTYDNRQFYIDGAWVDPVEPKQLTVINPATEEAAGVISMGSAKDVDRAVTAARRAFDSYSRTTPAERLTLMERILTAYKAHYDEIAQAISIEMGAPITLSKGAQTRIGVGHISAMIDVLKNFNFEELRGTVRLVQEPVGVCALITPWNWPMNQVAAKVIPALAAGCTMVLKPSEFSPFSAILWAKVMHEANVPAGVFNLINGDGPNVGAPLSSHKEVDMVSFTGSTRAGTEVAKNAAASVKRVHQELGGKSPNVLLEDADFERAVKPSVLHVFQNSGQSCNAPDPHAGARRPSWPRWKPSPRASRKASSSEIRHSEKTNIGPVVSKVQFERVEGYIAKGIAEGAKVVIGGAGRPDGLTKGYYVKPTIFSNVRNDMTIAREEIFGPVLCILPYDNEEQAVQIANDTPYGLAAYVWSQGQRSRAAHRRKDPRRPSHPERRFGQHEHAVRRLQNVRQRPRVGRIRIARLSGSQSRHRGRRRLGSEAGGRPGSSARASRQALFAGSACAVRGLESRAAAGRISRHHGRVRRRQVDAAQRVGGTRPSPTAAACCWMASDLRRSMMTR